MRFGDTNELFKLPRAHEPPPLTREESAPLWAWEKRISAAYAIAGVTMLGGILAHRWLGIGGDGYKTAVVGISFGLLGWATYLQRQARCPRCNFHIGQKFRMSLPAKCKGCGVAIPKEDEVAPADQSKADL